MRKTPPGPRRVRRLESAIRLELVCLWSSLANAVRAAQQGCWSTDCMNLTERILALTRLVGPTPWGEVSCLLLINGTYQRVHHEIGIEVSLPMDEVRAGWEWSVGAVAAPPRAATVPGHEQHQETR